jgi:hypothetical protein
MDGEMEKETPDESRDKRKITPREKAAKGTAAPERWSGGRDISGPRLSVRPITA